MFFELFYCLDLHYDRAFNEDIGNVFSNHVLFIVNFDWNLVLRFIAPHSQFNQKCIFVYLLQETRAKNPMHLEYSTPDPICDVIYFHKRNLLSGLSGQILICVNLRKSAVKFLKSSPFASICG